MFNITPEIKFLAKIEVDLLLYGFNDFLILAALLVEVKKMLFL
jgi:hypothetical protein